MKFSNLILSIALLIGITSCNPPVTFTEPQPTNKANLSKFPERMCGEYQSTTDQSILSIHENIIERTYDFTITTHSNQLDSGSIISGDSIINPATHEITMFKREGDSLIVHVHAIDTMFQLSDNNILRAFKGYYFLNLRYNDLDWEVQKVKLSGSKLMISKINSPLDPENLEVVKNHAQDTSSPYRVTMTQKEFKHFLKNEGFNDTETFIRRQK